MQGAVVANSSARTVNAKKMQMRELSYWMTSRKMMMILMSDTIPYFIHAIISYTKYRTILSYTKTKILSKDWYIL